MVESIKELKAELAKNKRQLKVYTDEISTLKSEAEDLRKGVSAKSKKKIEALLHKIRNLEESNKEYEGIIERFSEENNSLRDESLDAQSLFDDSELRRRKFKKRAIRIIRLLDRLLAKLPPSEREKFRDSVDFNKYARFYDKYLGKKVI